MARRAEPLDHGEQEAEKLRGISWRQGKSFKAITPPPSFSVSYMPVVHSAENSELVHC